MFILFAMQFPRENPLLRTMRDVPPPKDGAFHIVLHKMPKDFNWALTFQPDSNYRFLARAVDTSKPPSRPFEGNVDYKIADGRIDIPLDSVTGNIFFMNAYMPLHTKIFVETDDGKQIYKGEITERMRLIANGREQDTRSQPQPNLQMIIKPPPPQ